MVFGFYDQGFASMVKKRLLVSFSGGETSAFMAQWLWKNKRDEYEMVFVFANTGQENEETLDFIEKCSDFFGFPVVWIEAKVHHGRRKATTFTVVNYETADRSGGVFEQVIKKYGIPNTMTPHCTRDLKQRPIKAYANSIGFEGCFTAIGIREDEADRINKSARKLKLIYPLISMHPMTKPKINFWWASQPFRLELKGYQGNCMTCWKKSDVKLFQIAKESPEKYMFMDTMELKYGEFVPPTRLAKMKSRGETPTLPTTFFRGKRSAQQMISEAQTFNGQVTDDSLLYDLIGGESCEVFSECGN